MGISEGGFRSGQKALENILPKSAGLNHALKDTLPRVLLGNPSATKTLLIEANSKGCNRGLVGTV